MSQRQQPAGTSADRFRHASKYYTTGRPAYPPLLIDRVAELLGLDRRHAVLDLGTGQGSLAIAFAAHAGQVTAIEPSSDMLAVAQANAARAGVSVNFVQGSSADLGAHLGHHRLVTIGRAFHWMDRAETLRRLDQLVEPGGAVVLFSDRTPKVAANAWSDIFRGIREKYAAADRRRQDPEPVPHNDAVLLDSAFDAVERHSVLERRATPLPHFVDRVLSFGATWTEAGDSVAADVAADVAAALAPFAVDGVIHEVVEGVAVIARRSR